jgi:DNA mismatch repair protein MutH
MPDADERLTPASPDDLAQTLAFALRFNGRKRTRDAGEIMAQIVAERLVEHLTRSGFVVMKRPPAGGAAALGRGVGER